MAIAAPIWGKPKSRIMIVIVGQTVTNGDEEKVLQANIKERIQSDTMLLVLSKSRDVNIVTSHLLSY